MKMVVDKFIIKLESQLEEKNVVLTLSEEAYEWLSINGTDEKYGARPLQRLIDEKIKKPLADELLFGKLKSGGSIKVDVEKNEETKSGELVLIINDKKIIKKSDKKNKDLILH